MGLRDIESSLPPGFRFHPSDEELVCHYLYKKVHNQRISEGTMVEVDLHTREPWELPEVAKLSASEWYFFSFRDRKYSTGSRTNRATKSGYWKATGKDRTVYDPSTRMIVGMRKTLVFYRGRAPNGIKSGWVMHEFRLENPHTPPKEDWVLCRVSHKRKGEEENSHKNIMSSSSNQYSPTMDYSSPPPPSIINPTPTSMQQQQQQQQQQEGSHLQMSYNNSSVVPFHHEFHDHDQDHMMSSSSNLLNAASFLQCNFLDFPQEVESTVPLMEMGSKVESDDQFGLFLEHVGLGDHQDHVMGEGIFGNLGDFRFQGGKDKLNFI